MLNYRCPHCSGSLVYDGSSSKLKCQFCESMFTEDELRDTYNNLNNNQNVRITDTEANYAQQRTNVYRCPSCGAEVITDQTTAATHCYYCHSPLVLSEQLLNEFRPQKIIPFTKNKQQIQNVFVNWAKKFKYLPKDFLSQSVLEKFTTVYVPCWLADADCEGTVTAVATRTESHRSGDYIIKHTHYYNVVRDGALHYDNVLHDGSTKINSQIMESILPYNYNNMVDFSYSYLSGYMADRYDKTKEEVYTILKPEIERAAINSLKSTIVGYNGLINYGIQNANVQKVNFTYALLPVWVLTYSYNNQIYIYTVNDETGKIYGDMPLDGAKLNRTMALSGVAIAIGIYIICRLISNSLFDFSLGIIVGVIAFICYDIYLICSRKKSKGGGR